MPILDKVADHYTHAIKDMIETLYTVEALINMPNILITEGLK